MMGAGGHGRVGAGGEGTAVVTTTSRAESRAVHAHGAAPRGVPRVSAGQLSQQASSCKLLALVGGINILAFHESSRRPCISMFGMCFIVRYIWIY
jgi:hypothetical protein